MAKKKSIIKESIFGSVEQVKKISECEHEWEEKNGIIFDYIEVSFRCLKCGTYK
jgi:hypothetical protein